MRILVTGAAGFIGSHIVGQLTSQGAHKVVALDTSVAYDMDHRLPLLVQKITGDITMPISPSLFHGPVDAVIHLAGVGAPVTCNDDPVNGFNVNVQGTYQILKLAVSLKAKRFILASSAHVYAIPPRYLPTDEQCPLGLHDVYSTTKILDERLCQMFYENHGLEYIAIRLFNTYGPGQAFGYFVPDMARKASLGNFALRGGQTTKDWVYIDDTADAFIKALDGHYVGPLNIGSGQETTLKEIADYIAHEMGVECRPAENDTPPTRMLCNPQRAEHILGWKPAVSLWNGLDQTVRAMRLQMEMAR